MKLALIQYHVSKDKATTLARGLSALEDAARQGAKVAAFPELGFEWFHPQHPADSDPRATWRSQSTVPW